MYIEHRVACFLSQTHVLNQSAFESTSLSNSRDILMDMWSIQDEFIIKSSVLFNSILTEFDQNEHQIALGPNYESLQNNTLEENELIFSGAHILPVLVQEKNWNKCASLIEKIFKINPEALFIYKHCTQVFMELQEYSKLSAYANYVASSKRLRGCLNSSWIEVICNSLRANGHGDAVLQIASNFDDTEPQDFWAFKQISHVYEITDKNKALEYIKTSYSLNSSDRWVLSSYARILNHLGKKSELLDLLNKISEFNDQNLWRFQLLGSSYLALELLDKSLFLIKKGLEAYPQDQFLRELLSKAQKG
jgi:tetratricopeptide (TPR) repeat protein